MKQTPAGRPTADGSRPAILLPRVSFCHDCCCGTLRKHPGVDHDALRSELREGLRNAAVVTQSACLDVCEESNVIVVSPSPLGRRGGNKPVWLRKMLTRESVEELVDWVIEGGPGAVPMPASLKRHQMKRPT